MPKSKTLFDKAVSNYNTARILRENMNDDEEQLNIIAYHLQQALEFSIKYILEINGVEYPKTHSIDQLIAIASGTKVDLFLTDYIEDHSEMFSQWEEKSRYIIGYLVEKKKIDKALPAVNEYLMNIVRNI